MPSKANPLGAFGLKAAIRNGPVFPPLHGSCMKLRKSLKCAHMVAAEAKAGWATNSLPTQGPINTKLAHYRDFGNSGNLAPGVTIFSLLKSYEGPLLWPKFPL